MNVCLFFVRQQLPPPQWALTSSCTAYISLFFLITNKRKINTMTVCITTVCLCHLHSYVFRFIPITIGEFTTNASTDSLIMELKNVGTCSNVD